MIKDYKGFTGMEKVNTSNITNAGDGVYQIKIEGPIKAGMEFDLEGEFEIIINEPDCRVFEVDMVAVPYMNSAILKAFINTARTLHARGGKLHLLNISEDVYSLLDITRLTVIIDKITRKQA